MVADIAKVRKVFSVMSMKKQFLHPDIFHIKINNSLA